MRILVVEDERFLRELVRSCLVDQGYLVEAAGDGREALRVLEERDFDLLITDIRMPNMDGLALEAALREQNRRVRILFMSGHVPFETKELLGWPVIHKPFTLSELISAIRLTR